MTRVTAFAIFWLGLFSIGTLLEFIFQIEIVVDGRPVSSWVLLVSAITTGGLAWLLWQESRERSGTRMLCRNRVSDYAKWKAVFDAHADDHRAAGLQLTHLWQAVGDPNQVFFLFDVAAIDHAQAFIDAPESAEAGKESGVVDGEYHFIESA